MQVVEMMIDHALPAQIYLMRIFTVVGEMFGVIIMVVVVIPVN
jgi:hypothetical protein